MTDAPRGTPAQGSIMRAFSRPIRLFPPGLQRPTPAEVIAAAALPEGLADLAMRVIRKSGLWQSERVDVARELVSHFRDGLESGASPQDLAASFGDPAHAAPLIRRAKKRCRPLPWRAASAFTKSLGILVGAVLLLYAAVVARAFLTHPTISRNYLAEINATVESIPEADRAWPLYRSAYLAQPRMPEEIAKDFPAISPDDPRWPAALAYLKASATTIALLHQGAARPSLGRPMSSVVDPELDAYSRVLSGIDPHKARSDAYAEVQPEDPNPNLIGVLLPHLGQARHFARLLSLDVRAAAEAGDGARATADLETMYRLAGHMRDNGFLIGDLVALAIHSLADQTLGTVLAAKPDIFSGIQLASLAHAASRTPMTVNFEGERLFMADTLQRTYSDDGHGDGHLTAAGVRTLRGYSGTPRQDTPDAVTDALEVPLVTLVSASRREIHERYSRMLASTLEYAARSPWLRPDESPDLDVDRLANSLEGKRFMILTMLMPALNRAVWAHDEAAQRRDGLLTAIAVVLYRREHGAYPATLGDIPTALLPAIPKDMFDGQSIRYTLRDGKPVIYSIGADRKDDLGRAPAAPAVAGANPAVWRRAAEIPSVLNDPSRGASLDGDWILWPPPPAKPSPSLN